MYFGAMEVPRVAKRVSCDDWDTKRVTPVLKRIKKYPHSCAPNDINIDKNEFRIGRAKDNDEIILDPIISRKHCILRSEGDNEWVIKHLSGASVTFVNEGDLTRGVCHRIRNGDIIQFSPCEEYKYKFILVVSKEKSVKRPKMGTETFENIVKQRKAFIENQETQKRFLKEQLQTKQKEQDKLKDKLAELVKLQSTATRNKNGLKRQIIALECKIESGNVEEQDLMKMYFELLEKLDDKRTEFEKQLDDEKEKWKVALNISQREKEMAEKRMKERMEKWLEDQHSFFCSVMDTVAKQEKNKRTKLVNEKAILEEKLMEIVRALKKQGAKVETVQTSVAGTSNANPEGCVSSEVPNDSPGLDIIDTIDLTTASQITICSEEKESVSKKVHDIMDEQLTCIICSELFVKSTTLNCMHTFCHYCINSWNRKRKECPVCRAPMLSKNRSIALDNFIESMLENFPSQLKLRRNALVQERKAFEENKKQRC